MFSLRTLRQRCTAAGALLWFVLFSLPMLAQAPPSADTFVSSTYPTTNFGAVNSLAVGPGSTSYVQFNLSTIPAGATVSKATLRLYVDLVIKSGKFDVYQVNNSWSESTLNYNNQPLPLGASLTGGAGISITSASWNQFVLIDITSLVQTWVTSPNTNKGVALMLTSGSTGNFYFDAKESLLTANGPELEIALVGAGQQGPPGPKGDKGDKGDQGIPGAPGPQGPQGLKGDTGATGAQGPKGDTGAQGSQGIQGVQGTKGDPGPQGMQGPPGVPPPNVAVTDAGNTFAASQTINGNLVLGAGGGIQFSDGTTQNTASGGASGVPSGYMILSNSPVPPPGYSLVGPMSSGNLWSSIVSMTAARDSLAAATVNGKIFAIGGYDGRVNGGGVLNTVEVYDPSTNTWSTAASMPTARLELATAAVNGKIYAMGGLNSSFGLVNTVEVYDPSTDTWSTAASLPTARAGLAAAAVNGKIYAIGGLNNTYLNIVEAYDPSTNTWSTAASMPTARQLLAAAVVNGKIYAIGGLNNTYLNTVEIYDPSSDTWSTAASLPTARDGIAAAAVNGKIYASGGNSSGFLNTVEVYDSTANTWSPAAPMLTARYAAASADANGVVYVIGGNLNLPLSSVEQYSPPVTLYTFLKN